MKRQMHIIALRAIRHTDRSTILSAYSMEAGRVSFLMPAGTGREANRRRALLMPLAMVECVAEMKPGREVHVMHEPQAIEPLHSLRSHPVKSAIALFVAEACALLLRDGPPDAALYNYMCRSIMALETLPGNHVANFHLCFLYGLGEHLGIAPDTSDYRPGMIFDMLDGRFRMTPPMHNHFLSAEQSQPVALLRRINYGNMHMFRLTRQQRNELLDGILKYYSLHYTALGSLRSLEVLRELF